MEWKEYKLGDVCEITSSKRIFYSEYEDSGVPFYRSKEIINLFNKQEIATELFISEERYKEIKEEFGVPQKNDILLTSVGSIGIPYLVKENDKFYFKDGNLTWIRNYDARKIDPLFLYIWIISEVGKRTLEILSMGAAQAALTISRLKEAKIFLPSINEQRAIASILSNYDMLIDINTKRIKLLEESARELYKEWFVRMRFPGYEQTKFVKGIPQRWTYKKVTDLLDIKYGKDHKAIEEGDYPCYGSGGVMRCVNKYLYNGESVLIPRKGSLNNIMIANDSFWTIDTMFYTIPKMKNVAKYAYYMLSSVDMESLNAGAALPSMTTNILSNMDILLPSQDVLEQLETYLSPMFNGIETLTKENLNLAATRDRLLPRLLSGELKVKA
jgi:type I restriction enzyme S subunit